MQLQNQYRVKERNAAPLFDECQHMTIKRARAALPCVAVLLSLQAVT